MSNTEAFTCPNCGQAQLQATPQHTLACQNCGAEYIPPPVNVVDHIMERHQLQRLDRFTQRAEGIADLKAIEGADSRQRMQKLWDEERQRQETLAAQLVERKRQEVQLMRIALALLAIVAVVMLVILIATAPR